MYAMNTCSVSYGGGHGTVSSRLSECKQFACVLFGDELTCHLIAKIYIHTHTHIGNLYILY